MASNSQDDGKETTYKCYHIPGVTTSLLDHFSSQQFHQELLNVNSYTFLIPSNLQWKGCP